MDLIGQLSNQLGLDPRQAQALAGTVLGGVRDQVAEEGGAEQAQAMEEAIPELGTWEQTAGQELGGEAAGGGGGLLGQAAGALGGGGLGGLLGGAVGGSGGRQAAQLVGVLTHFGLSAKMAGVAAPILLSFLKERLPDSVLSTALAAAPFLTGSGGKGSGGGLGGLFG